MLNYLQFSKHKLQINKVQIIKNPNQPTNHIADSVSEKMFLNPSSAQPTMNISQQQQSQQQQSRPGDKFPPNTRVFIGNVDNAHVTKADLRNIFEKYGKLQEEPRLHKGFAFVQYDNTKSAEEAIKNENGRLLGNKRIGMY